ncbi:unnamed protein product [Pleuronectes platessa]|uniref:Uncharacterized protein n=1 Tax=Pleuronectes platessa TaxID=8262 RepID=A0A9N7YUW1_PLEPL|nr:unnamed protein product [Pleuronectes platessa]
MPISGKLVDMQDTLCVPTLPAVTPPRFVYNMCAYTWMQVTCEHGIEDGQSSGWFRNPGSINGKVKCEKSTDVVKGHSYQVNNMLDEKYKPHDPSIIVKETLEMVGSELTTVQTAGLITGVVAVGVLAALGAALFSSLSSKEEQKEEEEDYRKRRRRQHQHWH